MKWKFVLITFVLIFTGVSKYPEFRGFIHIHFEVYVIIELDTDQDLFSFEMKVRSDYFCPDIYRPWKDATSKFRKHEASDCHREAVERHVPSLSRHVTSAKPCQPPTAWKRRTTGRNCSRSYAASDSSLDRVSLFAATRISSLTSSSCWSCMARTTPPSWSGSRESLISIRAARYRLRDNRHVQQGASCNSIETRR